MLYVAYNMLSKLGAVGYGCRLLDAEAPHTAGDLHQLIGCIKEAETEAEKVVILNWKELT